MPEDRYKVYLDFLNELNFHKFNIDAMKNVVTNKIPNVNKSEFLDHIKTLYGDNPIQIGMLASILETSHIVLKKSKLFYINSELCDLFCLTDNNIEKKILPFPVVFISNIVKITDNLYCHGILLFVVDENYNIILSPSEMYKTHDIYILTFTHTKRELMTFDDRDTRKGVHSFHISGVKFNRKPEVIIPQGSSIELLNDSKKVERAIALFVCNWLDFLNDPDVILREVRRSDDSDSKRLLRGKPALPKLSVIIDVTGRLILYINKLKSGKHMSYSHRFWVRGHWKTLRSEKWKNKRGCKIWIMPFIKGEGILIEKSYKIKSNINQEVTANVNSSDN